MEKIRVHVDSIAQTGKPDGDEWVMISKRIFQEENIVSLTVQGLAEKLESGHTICPAVINGSHASDWQEQQVFMIDVDNDDPTQPYLNIKQALNICDEYGLAPAICYQTFSYIKEHPKLRLVFIMDTPINHPDVREKVVEGLVRLFPQADKACTDANRRFLGTNKKVVLRDENARISVADVEATHPTPESETHDSGQLNHSKTRKDPDLEKAIHDFDFLSYLKERNGECRESGNTVYFKKCGICGHKDDLVYYKDTKSFFCFSSSGNVGGSIIDYIMHSEGLTMKEAINKFKNELNNTEQSDDELEWVEPTPLETFKLPRFPVRNLPDPLRSFVSAVAANTETAVDMAAVAGLALIASAVQGKFEFKHNKNYSEPLNLYTLIIARSGERKSSIIKMMTKVYYQFEREINEQRMPDIKKDEAQLNIWQNEISKLEKGRKFDQASKLREKYCKLEQTRTKPLRLIADDATSEALTSLLYENDGRLTIISTEGGIFDTLDGKYSNKVSIDTILKAYTGDPIRVDRKVRAPEAIDKPTLTMIIAAQESVLYGLLDNATFKSRGLTARFLFCKPKSKIGKRVRKTPEINEDLENKYNKLIRDLLSIPYPEQSMPLLEPDEKADETLTDFFNWVEPQLNGELENTAGWAEKFVGTTSRIAGLLHCIKHGKLSSKVEVTEQTVNDAIAIAKYFLEHAKYTFSLMGADRALQGAKNILKRLEAQSEREFSKYEIFKLCRSNEIKKADDILPALELLIEQGYMYTLVKSEPTGGRPRGNTYILNPLHFDS